MKKTSQETKNKKVSKVSRDENIQCGGIRDDQNVSNPNEYHNKEYICDLLHTAKSGNLKGEDNPSMVDKGYLKGKCCSSCGIYFVGRTKLSGKTFKISYNTLCYACCDQAYIFFICSNCYTCESLRE